MNISEFHQGAKCLDYLKNKNERTCVIPKAQAMEIHVKDLVSYFKIPPWHTTGNRLWEVYTKFIANYVKW